MPVTITTSNWKQAAADDLRRQLEECLQEVRDCEKQARVLEERRDQASERVDEIKAAARTLGLNLTPFELTPPEEPPPARRRGMDGSLTAADIILDALSESYPKPRRSGELRLIIQERLGRPIHAKTPGMSLYRLAKAGKVRREGVNWFLQPKREAPIDAIAE